ncbi:MAG TPA: hypothetical protein VMU07_01880 [Candidatus Paceibacterota bacterium]|nr:hypothetical protein [Candidatus Paceibacterota bacterium]
MMRFLLACLFLALAFVLQFWFASIGISINFIFTALIAFAFLFDFWDVLFFILAAIFVVNWQPAMSWEMFILAAIPFAAYLLHNYSTWEAWVANLACIVIGLLILYIAIAPRFFTANLGVFFVDLFGCLIFGSIVFGALNRREGR